MRLVNLLGLLMTALSAFCLVDFYVGNFVRNSGPSPPAANILTASPPLQTSPSFVSTIATIAFEQGMAREGPQQAAPYDAPKSVQAGDEKARRELAIEIKRGLKRLGCFDGRLNGEWDQFAQAAMSAFIQRVNASLPVSQPNLILLSLVRAQTKTCVVSCSQDQSVSAQRDCPPSVGLVQGNAAQADQETSRNARVPYSAQRMSLGATTPKRPPMHSTIRPQSSMPVAAQRSASWSKKAFYNPSGR